MATSRDLNKAARAEYELQVPRNHSFSSYLWIGCAGSLGLSQMKDSSTRVPKMSGWGESFYLHQDNNLPRAHRNIFTKSEWGAEPNSASDTDLKMAVHQYSPSNLMQFCQEDILSLQVRFQEYQRLPFLLQPRSSWNTWRQTIKMRSLNLFFDLLKYLLQLKIVCWVIEGKDFIYFRFIWKCMKTVFLPQNNMIHIEIHLYSWLGAAMPSTANL